MSEQLFDVVFFGILQTGKDKATVIQNMATLFKSEPGKLAAYFAGGRKVIKGKVNADTAEKYRLALENVGLVIKIEPCEVTSNTAVAEPSDTEKSATQTNRQPEQTTPETSNFDNASSQPKDSTGLSIAPVGVDVLEHPTKVSAQKIEDISNISMADAGADIIVNPVEAAPQKITGINNFTLAEVGSNVLDHSPTIIVQQIGDITDITMADAGTDLIANPEPERPTDIPDTSNLSLDTKVD